MANSQRIFQLLPITWQALAAVGTLLAVLVALFAPSFRDRRNLKISAMLGYLHDAAGNRSDLKLTITVRNLGKPKVVIEKLGMRCSRSQRHKYGRKFSMVLPEPLNALPRAVEYLDSLTILVPALDDLLQVTVEAKRLFIVDAAGKLWWLGIFAMRRFKREARDELEERASKVK